MAKVKLSREELTTATTGDLKRELERRPANDEILEALLKHLQKHNDPLATVEVLYTWDTFYVAVIAAAERAWALDLADAYEDLRGGAADFLPLPLKKKRR